MIKFKCIYCGQKILAKDDGAGQKGKCPKCAHLLTVPASTKGRPAISVNKEPSPDRPDAPLVPESKQLPEWPEKAEEQAYVLAELCKERLGFLVPTYDKLSLLLMALILILIYLTNPKMTGQLLSQMQNLVNIFLKEILPSPKIAVLIVWFIAFILYKFFIFDEKTDIKKKIMINFAVVINIIAGIFTGIYVIQNTTIYYWMLVFPIWNIINGILMLLMFCFEIIDEDCISDRKATLIHVFLGLIAIVAIFLLCNYVLKLYWAITFSICIIYTTSFDRALQSVFPGLTRQEAEVES
jgi:hypothetical protein